MDQIRLMYLMHYDQDTGVFTRLTSNRRDRIGVTPGARNTNGHVQIRVDGVLHMAHRLAWLYVHGSFPQKQLDHINGDKTDNRISNLRHCSNKKNAENRKMSPRNTSGYRGVSFDKTRGKFKAYIGHEMRAIHIGLFAAVEDAAVAAKGARDELFTHHKTSYSA
jgi:hypothetical protein